MSKHSSYLVKFNREEFKFRSDARFHHPKYKEFPFKKEILRPLGEIIKTVNRKPKADNNYPYIELGSVDKKDSQINPREQLEVYQSQDLPSRAKKVVKPGDILVSKLGKTVITVVGKEHKNCAATNAFIICRPKINLSSELLAITLRLPPVKKQLERYSYGQRRRITNRNFKRIEVPIPGGEVKSELEKEAIEFEKIKHRIIEQYRNLFDQMEAKFRDKLDLELEEQDKCYSFKVPGQLLSADKFAPDFYNPKYMNLLTSIRDHQFANYSLGELVEEIVIGPPLKPKERGTVEYLTSKNIESMEINLEDLNKAESVKEETKLKENDVIVVSAGYKLGTAAVIKEEIENLAYNNHIYRLILKDEIDSYYLALYLNSKLAQKQFARYAGGRAQQNINRRDLSKVEVLVPKLKKQLKIADQINNLQKKVKTKYQELKTREKALENELLTSLTD